MTLILMLFHNTLYANLYQQMGTEWKNQMHSNTESIHYLLDCDFIFCYQNLPPGGILGRLGFLLLMASCVKEEDKTNSKTC